MKKRFINRLAAFILFAMMGANLFSQGFYVYTKDGQRQDYASENVDSIVFYEKTAEDIVGNFINGHEYVDLGLPSGLKWATCNVGASKPEEYGGCYAWGETEEKSDYSWETYKWCKGTWYTMTKYCTDSDYGTVDNLTTLTSSDDVATVKWGSKWRMPSMKEMRELVEDCTWEWTSLNEVNGMKVTGPNGNSIFLPAAGDRDGTDFYGRGSGGLYWSATLLEGDGGDACHLNFGSGGSGLYDWNDRSYGRSVRPVTDELLSDSEK